MDDADQIRQDFLKALSRFEAEDVLTPISQVTMFERDASYADVMALVKESGFSRFPVYQDGIDNIVGVLHIHSLLSVSEKGFHLQEYVNKPFVISENTKLDDLFQKFNKQKTHFALVVDEHGSLRGIITMEDILESLLGDIEGEFDASQKEFSVQLHGKNSYTVDPRMTLEDFNARFKTSFSGEECDTIGGYVMEILGHVPAEGESLNADPYRITVAKAQGPKLLELSVAKK